MMLEQRITDDSIIQRLRDYGVTGSLDYSLKTKVGTWCLKMLATCDRKAKADGDLVEASWWCKKFAKNPDGYDPDRGRNKPASDDYEDRENDYHMRRERDEQLAMVGEV